MNSEIMNLDYIENNKAFTWIHDEYMEVGRKGVVANDLGYDYDQVSCERLRIFEDADMSFTIQKYLIRVKINSDLTVLFIGYFHINWSTHDMRVYYVKL